MAYVIVNEEGRNFRKDTDTGEITEITYEQAMAEASPKDIDLMILKAIQDGGGGGGGQDYTTVLNQLRTLLTTINLTSQSIDEIIATISNYSGNTDTNVTTVVQTLQYDISTSLGSISSTLSSVSEKLDALSYIKNSTQSNSDTLSNVVVPLLEEISSKLS